MAKRRLSSDYDPNHGVYKSTVNRPVKVSFSEFRFVRIELTAAEKDEFRGMLASGEYDNLDFTPLLREGYKLSVSYDLTHSTVVASITAQYKDMLNAGLVLSARAGSEPAARAMLLHKHSYICGDDGWAASESSRGGSYDDIG